MRRLTAVYLASLLAVAGCSTTATPAGQTAPAGSTRSDNSGLLSLNGLTMTLPSGWVQAKPTVCGQITANSVAVYSDPRRAADCGSQDSNVVPAANVALVPIWGSWGSTGWSGTPTTWNGQSALLTTSTPPGASQPTTTMALPLLNVTVIIANVDAHETADLLAHMSPRLGTGLGIPEQASRVTVSHASDGGHKDTTDQAEITRILSAMRAVATSTDARPCPTTTSSATLLDSVVVTLTSGTVDTRVLVTTTRECSQVAGGNGQAGPVTPEVLSSLSTFSFPRFA